MVFIQSTFTTTNKVHTASFRHQYQKVSSVTLREAQGRSESQKTIRARLQCKTMAIHVLAGS